MSITKNFQRKKTKEVNVGGVVIGGHAPVVVQSMTNTDTADIEGTTNQIIQLSDAGSEIVRITVNSEPSARAVPEICRRLDLLGYDVPLVGDFHYNGHKLLKDFDDCAQALAKYRINPGNVGQGKKRDDRFCKIIEIACKHSKPIRIGVNWGSLDPELLSRKLDENSKSKSPLSIDVITRHTLIESALNSAKLAQREGLPANRIILSAKVSSVKDLVKVYTELSEQTDLPLHLGLTEAGMADKGVVFSTAALVLLLNDGIGDTIRVSLTPKPNESRTREVRVAQEILQSLGLRSFAPSVTACPGCGRTTSDFFQKLASEVEDHLRAQMIVWRDRYPGVESMSVAVMGCIVNGPGESKQADIGISLPGTGENPAAPVFQDGEKVLTLRGDNIAKEFIEFVESYVIQRYGGCVDPSFSQTTS